MHHPLEQPRRPQNQQHPDPNQSTDVAAKTDLASPSTKTQPASAAAAVADTNRDSQDSSLDDDYSSDTERTELDHRSTRQIRDSHDLSLPSKNFTRDSLLGNMLTSLDQFSLSQINTPVNPAFEEEDDDDGDPYGVPRTDAFTRSMTNSSRVRNTHEHGYSLSSDFEVSEDGGSKISSQVSPGRRRCSDSSSVFQSSLQTINNMCQRGFPVSPDKGAFHSRDMSSNTNDFDLGGGGFAQALPTQRREHELGAPNPTVPSGPGGPRRTQAPSSSAYNPPATPSAYEPERKKDSRSRSGTNKSKYDLTREVAPLSPPLDLSAPVPQFSYGKAKDIQQTGPLSAPPVKEKQGFFSRLFGSSRLTASPTVEPTSTPASSVMGEPLQQVMSEIKPLSAPPTRDSEASRQMPHVVQKKSSFFRRRKKSNAEPPVPPLPLAPPIDLGKGVNTTVPTPTTEVSPPSSLREIMNPYLKAGTRAVTNPPHDGATLSVEPEAQNENNRKARGFSPEYEPNPSATIRTVKSTSALKNKESKWLSQPDSSIESPPEIPSKYTNNADATFFHDSSDEGEGMASPKSKPRAIAQSSKLTAHKLKMGPLSPGFSDPTQAILEDPIEGMEGGMSRSMLSRSVSNVPSVIVDSSRASPLVPSGPLDEPEVTVGEPTEDDRQKAQAIFDGDEEFISKEKAASWMGEEGLVRQRTLRAYMDLYDFENQSILTALRQVCSRLVFRAETQQVDRILVAFSNRWCNCNPNHGFKTIDVIHTMCYSIMLLNTDLHLADIEQKMTRNQFIKNTMSTITEPFETSATETLNQPCTQSNNSLLSPAGTEMHPPANSEPDKTSWRASFKPLPRSESSQGFHNDWAAAAAAVDTCGPLVKAPFDGPLRAWEGQMETVLKDIYNSIRDEKLPLFGASASHQQPQAHGGLAMIGRLKRSPSVLSKAPSESHAYSRGRLHDSNRMQGNRWISKSRSRPRLPNGFSSSRTSFEDSSSIWSPATSSATWSRHSLGRTQTSLSVESFNSGFPNGDYQQSIGFANALSQAIIRDDYPVGNSSQSIMSSEEFQTNQLLDDESLELLGPPWVKEGIVTHKHHLDGVDKKAKDRNWNEVFAVVQKGTLSIFSFSTKSTRQKARVGRKPGPGAVVGGGNWQENATNLGSFSLRHTLASALPAPGYSRNRPHVWALSLPSGAVHLFQVGTPEISKEFILTVNYWSARLSTHPLMGGISNVEYGWSDAAINSALIGTDEPSEQRPGSAAATRANHSRQGSRQSSLRSSFDIGGGLRSRLPGDRIHIADWSPPSQSLRPSQCSESEQLETLQAYVNSVENEFQQHNQLRSPMLLAFTPRGLNAVKSMANWERKSSYLLREIVKFRTYVDSLQHASERRKEIYAERENARRAARGEDIEDSASAYSKEDDAATKTE